MFCPGALEYRLSAAGGVRGDDINNAFVASIHCGCVVSISLIMYDIAS